jgi:hypothetical protein
MSDINMSRTKTAEAARTAPVQARDAGKRKSKKVVIAPLTRGQLAREHVKRYLVQRFYTRFHMSLILMSAGLAAMLGNWVLLQMGLRAMWLRYPLAITLAYFTFLAGVWLWLQYVQSARGDSRTGDGADLLNVDVLPGGGGGSASAEGFSGAGGGFDGGGAAGEWAEGAPVQALVAPAPPSTGGVSTSSDFGKSFGDFGDLDGDGAILIVLAIALIAAVLFTSGYVIWFAPDILTEALFGATLAGSLARTAKRQDDEGWVLGVVKKTWWPFAIVMAVGLVFGIYAASHFPGAATVSDALAMAAAR